MLTLKRQLKDIAAVAAGATALINVPIGNRIKRINLVLGDSAAGNTTAPTISATCNEIRVNLGGKIIRKYTPTQLDAINTAMGAEFASQAYTGAANGGGRRELPIFFEEPWRKRTIDSEALGICTGWLGQQDNFTVEVDLKTGITPVLQANYMFDEFKNGGNPNLIMKWLPRDINAAVTPLQITTMDRQELLSQISFFDPSGGQTVDDVLIEADGVELFSKSKNNNTTDLKGFSMNPAAGAFHVVFDHDDRLDSCLPLGGYKSFLAQLTMSTTPTGTLRYIVQRLGDPRV